MAPSAPPDEGMFGRVPVGRCPLDCLADVGPALEPAPRQRQGAQHLPPGLNQVQGGGVLRLKDDLPARMDQREEQHVGRAMRAQILPDGLDALDLRGEPAVDLVEEVHPISGGPAAIGGGERIAGGGAEGAKHLAGLTPAVIDRLAGTPRRARRRVLLGGGGDQALTRPALGHFGTPRVEADHHPVGRRADVPRFYRPLFCAQSGSTRSPHHVSGWRQRQPSVSNPSPSRLRFMAMPFCSRQ